MVLLCACSAFASSVGCWLGGIFLCVWSGLQCVYTTDETIVRITKLDGFFSFFFYSVCDVGYDGTPPSRRFASSVVVFFVSRLFFYPSLLSRHAHTGAGAFPPP